MKRRRRRKRRKSDFLPEPRPPETSPIRVLEELNESFVNPSKGMSEEVRRSVQTGTHDQIGKTLLHLSALAMHRQQRQAKLAAASDFITNFISDPEYLRGACKDPEIAMKILKMLHTIDQNDTKFLMELALGIKKKDGDGWDAKDSINPILGAVGANMNNLPPELQDPNNLRAFRQQMQTFIDLMRGEDTPTPPKVKQRVIEGPESDKDADGD